MARVDVLELLIDVVTELSDVRQGITELKSLDETADAADDNVVDIPVDVNTAKGKAKLAELEAQKEALESDMEESVATEYSPMGGAFDGTSIKDNLLSEARSDTRDFEFIDIVTELSDVKQGIAELKALDESVDRVDDRIVDIPVDVDSSKAEANLARLEAQKEALESDMEESVATEHSPMGRAFGGGGTSGTNVDPLTRKLGKDFGSDFDGTSIKDNLLSEARSDIRDFELEEGIDLENLGSEISRKIGRFDRARDEGSASGRLTRLARKFDDTIGDVNLRMSQFHDLLADLLPVIFVLIGAIAPVITGMIALGAAAVAAAGALGAMVGLGAFGMGRDQAGGTEGSFQAFRQELQDVGEEVLTTLEPLADKFAPLMRDALDGVLRLVERITDAGRGLLQLRDDAQAFGQFISNALVSLVRIGSEMVEAFSPVFSMIADFFRESSFLRDFTGDLADILPQLVIAARGFMTVLGGIVDIGKGFLDVVAIISVFLGLINWALTPLKWFLGLFIDVDRAVGFLIASMLVFITVLALAAKVTSIYLTLKSAEITTLNVLASSVYGYIASLYGAIQAKLAAIPAVSSLTASLGALLVTVTLLTGGLILLAGGLSILASKFSVFSGDVANARGELERFADAENRIGGGGLGGTGSIGFGGQDSASGGNYYETNVNISGGDENTMRRETRKIFNRQQWSSSKEAGQ